MIDLNKIDLNKINQILERKDELYSEFKKINSMIDSKVKKILDFIKEEIETMLKNDATHDLTIAVIIQEMVALILISNLCDVIKDPEISSYISNIYQGEMEKHLALKLNEVFKEKDLFLTVLKMK